MGRIQAIVVRQAIADFFANALVRTYVTSWATTAVPAGLLFVTFAAPLVAAIVVIALTGALGILRVGFAPTASSPLIAATATAVATIVAGATAAEATVVRVAIVLTVHVAIAPLLLFTTLPTARFVAVVAL